MKDTNKIEISFPKYANNEPDITPKKSKNNRATLIHRNYNVNDALGLDNMALLSQLDRLKEDEQIRREEKNIELLEEIRDNTGSLVNMVNMIRFNSDQQTDIMLIITEILAIGTASTPEEAESLYKKVMDKINHTIESGENIAKLTTWATAAWTLVNKIPL